MEHRLCAAPAPSRGPRPLSAWPYAVGTVASQADIEGRARSADGTEIVYVVRGGGAVALVFIHGGFADRTFWAPQLAGLAGIDRVVALDLAGHGESGRGRAAWTIPAFAQDVRAVVEALDLRRVVLIGNSLGGPVALEAAPLLPGRVLGVVGVDTFQDAMVRIDPAHSRARAEAFRKDFAGACRGMAAALFHSGAHLDLRAWAERRMCALPPEIGVGMMEGFAGYDMAESFRNAGVPIRCINGDLWPTSVANNRKLVADFDAVILPESGHYVMLERPDDFNRHLNEIVRKLAG